MKTFTASRLSGGNTVLACKVTIHNSSITLIIPEFNKGDEITISFGQIAGVEINTPDDGFSTITISTTDKGDLIAKGFTKTEVKEMLNMIMSEQEDRDSELEDTTAQSEQEDEESELEETTDQSEQEDGLNETVEQYQQEISRLRDANRENLKSAEDELAKVKSDFNRKKK